MDTTESRRPSGRPNQKHRGLRGRKMLGASLAGSMIAALLVVAPVTAASAADTTPIAPVTTGATIDVTDAPYSAAGDGVTNDRLAIQAALDATTNAGGGTVVLPAGHTFLSGDLRVGSHTQLLIEGTLLQSQVDSHYSGPVLRGANKIPSTVNWDHLMFTNTPLVYAGNATDVAIGGSGLILMTRENPANHIHAVPIGFYRVDKYSIRDLTIEMASTYNLALFTTSNGLVENMTINLKEGYGSGDGISLQNSQHIRITDNWIRSGDDGVYVWSSYADPRGGSWWSSENPQPSLDIEVDNNDISVEFPNCCKAFAFIAWGANAPDQNSVAISDVSVHDNILTSLTGPGSAAVDCWCDDPYTSEANDHSIISDVTFANNTYNGGTNLGAAGISNLVADFDVDSTTNMPNGDFAERGLAGWSVVGDVVGVERPDGDFAAQLTSTDGTSTALYQGISLGQQLQNETPRYKLTAEVAVRGEAMRLFAYDTCTGTVLAEKWVTGAARHPEELVFDLATKCGNVRLGIDNGGTADGTSFLYGVTLRAELDAILATDPVVDLQGGPYLFMSAAGSLGGLHILNHPPGDPSSIVVPFHGTRAILLGSVDVNLGTADVFIDGVKAADVSFVHGERLDAYPVFTSEELAPGDHVFELRWKTGYMVYNALLVEDEITDAPTVAAPQVAGATDSAARTVTFPAVAGAGASRIEVFDANNERVAFTDVAAGALSGSITLPGSVGTYDVRVRFDLGNGSNVVSPVTSVVLESPVIAESTVTVTGPAEFTVGTAQVVTATVSSGSTVPTGTVQFTVDGVDYSTAQALDSAGKAVLDLSGLAVGTFAIGASYSGTEGIASSSATTPLSVSVIAVVVTAPVAEIELTASSLTVAQGGSVTLEVEGFDENGESLGDVTSRAVITSNYATDIVEGNRVTFPTASTHVLTAVVDGVSMTVSVTVVPTPVTPEVPTPGTPVAAAPTPAVSAHPNTGLDITGLISAALALLILGGLVAGWNTRRRIGAASK